MNRFEQAKEMYARLGTDVEKALAALDKIPVSMHCWQGDDVNGFDSADSLSGGIQATGNYAGKARNFEELTADMEVAFKYIAGKKRINLHASYAVTDEKVERDAVEPKHFDKWLEFAKKNDLGIDMNPTFFSHPLSENGTLSAADETVREFWVRHAKAVRKISAYIGEKQGSPCLCNVWIPDGMKDIPADRVAPRARLKKSLDEIYSVKYDDKYIADSVESKVFGIGLESYTVGSFEFYMNYAAKNGICCLLDNGHYHPTEMVSDKISSMLLFNDKLALHVTRPVRWDSDHVVLFEDELREIAKEIVFAGAEERVLIGLDYFDASINRIAAWIVGMNNMRKALLYALLLPAAKLKKLQAEGNNTELMVLNEECKTLPFGDIWDEYLRRSGVEKNWLPKIRKYEQDVLLKR
ncbi:MAG: L-rhamnose isomerase [Bacillota bacterium]|nr:MAG: L-rhamnose isomerase [Bacillota bacterium]